MITITAKRIQQSLTLSRRHIDENNIIHIQYILKRIYLLCVFAMYEVDRLRSTDLFVERLLIEG